MTVAYWLIIAAVMLVIEIMTMGLTSIWFTGGALVAAAVCAVHAPFWLQVVAFLAVSVILLLCTRSLAKNFINNKTIKTNAESLIGQICIVTQEIDNLHNCGQVNVKGQEWTARSYDDDILIARETRVMIQRISGVKLIVKPQD